MATYRPKLAGGLHEGEQVFAACEDAIVLETIKGVSSDPFIMDVVLSNGRRYRCRYDRLFYVPMPNHRLSRWQFVHTK